MKYFKLSIAAFLITALLFVFCNKDNICIRGEGPIITQTLAIPNFTGIDLQCAAGVVISQGPTQLVSATGNANIIDRMHDDVSNGVWDIDLGNQCFDNYDLTIFITVPDINAISISGAGNITVNDFINQGDLSLNISGSGGISLHTFNGTENLSVTISGAGNISGTQAFNALKNLDIKISGSGNYNGFPIETNTCIINIPGSGNCQVYVNDTLDVTISGSGSVYYKGSPTVTANISGSGVIVDSN